MSVVAPITALLSAAVPVVAGYAEGERPGAAAVVGMALALVAIVLVSAEGGGSLRPPTSAAVTYALGAGLGFGLFFVALSHTGDDAGMWPLVAARGASVAVVGSVALLGFIPRTPPTPGSRALTAAAGALDAHANVLYLLAVREGLVSVVSVLAALYPVSTVVLARVVLHERFAPRAGRRHGPRPPRHRPHGRVTPDSSDVRRHASTRTTSGIGQGVGRRRRPWRGGARRGRRSGC